MATYRQFNRPHILICSWFVCANRAPNPVQALNTHLLVVPYGAVGLFFVIEIVLVFITMIVAPLSRGVVRFFARGCRIGMRAAGG